MKFSGSAPRILDFDTESRPLSWFGGEFVTQELTAIAAKFIGEKKMYLWALGEDEPRDFLEGFRELYNQADMLTGHFIRGHDLPVLQAAMLDFDLPPLGSKLTQDTKNDLLRLRGISKSQENLGALLGLSHPKVSMDQAKWRAANRLTPKGIAETKRRVVGDVKQHIELRAELLRRGMLSPPKMWHPAGANNPQYQA